MRAAADALRAELVGDTVTFVVNRNINVSNVCTVGCAFCGFGQGKRSPDAYEHSEEDFAQRIADARAALPWSVASTLAALLAFGYAKGRVTSGRPIRSALHTALVGGLAAAAAFGIARLFN